MTATLTCTECNVEREYSHISPRQGGYALVYECPNCGDTEAYEEDLDKYQHRA